MKNTVETGGLRYEGSLDAQREYSEQPGHYVRTGTPYAYQPKLGRKYVPPMHVDLGQGLLQLIDVVRAMAVDAGHLPA